MTLGELQAWLLGHDFEYMMVQPPIGGGGWLASLAPNGGDTHLQRGDTLEAAVRAVMAAYEADPGVRDA